MSICYWIENWEDFIKPDTLIVNDLLDIHQAVKIKSADYRMEVGFGSWTGSTGKPSGVRYHQRVEAGH